MSEPKVIELTEEEYGRYRSEYIVPVSAIKASEQGQDVLLKAPQPKLVHLSGLPDGTKVKGKFKSHYGYKRVEAFVHSGGCWLSFNAKSGYMSSINLYDIVLLPGEFQPWMGGECPWPEFVEVETLIADSEKVMKPWIMNGGEEYAGCWTWQKGHKQVIAHRCTGRLLDGAKLVP